MRSTRTGREPSPTPRGRWGRGLSSTPPTTSTTASAGPYGEGDVASPISVYGQTKVAAERAIEEALDDHLIIRTTAVYGWNPTSPNFAMHIWQRLGDGETLQAPSDQITTPTLADYLAAVSLLLVQGDAQGAVNVVGADRLSRAEFAQVVARSLALDAELVEPTPTSELGQAAARPLEGGLRTDRLRALLDTEPMPLDEALKRLRRQWRASTYVASGPKAPSSDAEVLKQEILAKVREYHSLAHMRPPFVPGESRVMYSGRTFGAEEIVNVVDAGLDFWLTLGPYGDLFERQLASYVGCRDTVLVNSGSSANLTAVMALMSPQLQRPLAARRRGDHARRHVPDHARPDRPVWPRARVRRLRARDLQHRPGAARGGDLAAHTRSLHPAHARQPVRAGHRQRARPRA